MPNPEGGVPPISISNSEPSPRFEREGPPQPLQVPQHIQQHPVAPQQVPPHLHHPALHHELLSQQQLHEGIQHLPHALPVNHVVPNYQHYIPPHAAMPHLPMGYAEDVNKDDSSKKRRRTNYKDPEHAGQLNAALNALINQDGDGQKDLKTVSKMFNLPYNTLRDNYLK